MLTDKELKGLKITDKDYYVNCGMRTGLYVRVWPSGKKQFVHRYKVNGKTKFEVVGEYPTIGLAEARKLAVNFNVAEEAESEDVPTVDKVFADFYKRVAKRYVDPKMFEYKYKKYIQPTLGSRDIRTIKRTEVAKMLDKIVDRGAPVMANRVLTDIKLIFSFAVERGIMEDNVLLALTKKSVGGKENKRDRVVSVDEIKKLLIEFGIPRLDYRTRAALALALLTGQRASEVLGIRETQIHGRWWHIPANQKGNKNKKLHKVYLSPQARLVLKIVPPPYVSDHRVLARGLKRYGAGYTTHDFRRTITTHLNNMGVMPHITEKMLNHSMEGVMAVYNHAEYLPERRQAWLAWGNYVWQLRREALRQKPQPSV